MLLDCRTCRNDDADSGWGLNALFASLSAGCANQDELQAERSRNLGMELGDCWREPREPPPLRAPTSQSSPITHLHVQKAVNKGTHSTSVSKQPQTPASSDSAAPTLTDAITSDRIRRQNKSHQHALEGEMKSLIHVIRVLEQEVQVLERKELYSVSDPNSEDDEREVELEEKLKELKQHRIRLTEIRTKFHEGDSPICVRRLHAK